jgi:hypothetical protein
MYLKSKRQGIVSKAISSPSVLCSASDLESSDPKSVPSVSRVEVGEALLLGGIKPATPIKLTGLGLRGGATWSPVKNPTKRVVH